MRIISAPAKILAVAVAALALTAIIWGWQPIRAAVQSPDRQSEYLASVRAPDLVTDWGIPDEDLDIAYTVRAWSAIGPQPGPWEVDEDSQNSPTPLMWFGAVGEYRLSLRLIRGVRLPDGTETEYPEQAITDLRIVVLPAVVDPEAIFRDWDSIRIAPDRRIEVRAGEYDQ